MTSKRNIEDRVDELEGDGAGSEFKDLWKLSAKDDLTPEEKKRKERLDNLLGGGTEGAESET